MSKKLKLVVVGNGGVGKTSILTSFVTNQFDEQYQPTVFDNFVAKFQVDGKPLTLTMFDTAGQESYERIRPLSYPGTDVFLVVYSMQDRASFKAITQTWIPELEHHAPSAIKILVGAKLDLRGDLKGIADAKGRGMTMVTLQEGQALAKEMNMDGFQECSAKTQLHLKSVFDLAVQLGLRQQKKQKRKYSWCFCS